MRSLSNLGLLLSLSFGVWGCSPGADGPPKLYPVTGTLMVGGKPLENISVQLSPVNAESKIKPGIGVSDAEGKFTILTNGDKGAAAGKYKVTLQSSATAKRTGPMSVEEATKMNGEMMQKMAQSGGNVTPPAPPFPAVWADAKTSPKEVEVVDKPVIVNIDI